MPSPTCPDCDSPVTYAFHTTSGLGAQKQGDGFNTTPDTAHYLCMLCLKAWKQRMAGPFTPDIVGDLAFFSCRVPECGARLDITRESDTPAGTEMACSKGHRYRIEKDGDGLRLAEAR
jgi:hypothetical protein